MEKLMHLISRSLSLQEQQTGEFSTLKVKGMTFTIRSFAAEGFGHVSTMSASGFLGLMKMDTLILNPFEKDMPLLSYDRIRAMGKDSLYLELYNTMLGETDLSALDGIAETYKALPSFDPGSHWYDPIKLPQSLFKRGKKQHTAAFSEAAEAFLAGYLLLCREAPGCDREEKKEKAAAYSGGLLANGGPAADVFIGKFGREKTGEFFRNILFGA